MNSPQLLPRILTPRIQAALSNFPVVVVTGARQTGKTTLVQMHPLSQGRTFRSLDDFDVLERAQRSPNVFVEEADRLTIDEVQRTPDLLLAIKRAVDKERRPGRYLLTGSANLLMMRRVSESLAGRAMYLTLQPMTVSERQGVAWPGPWDDLVEAGNVLAVERALPKVDKSIDWAELAARGGFPVATLKHGPDSRPDWFEGYIRTYLERDLQDVGSVSSLVDFRRLMRLASLRTGRLLNQSELGRDAALPQPTVHRWLNLLETSFQIVRIPAYASNRTKRLIKTPKLYWCDTGLACHLAGQRSPDALMKSDLAGALLENLLLSELLAWREIARDRVDILYWRTHGGHEVDFVLEKGGSLLPIEVKHSARVSLSDSAALIEFMNQNKKSAPWGMVVYRGTETIRLAERILAVPLGSLLGSTRPAA